MQRAASAWFMVFALGLTGCGEQEPPRRVANAETAGADATQAAPEIKLDDAMTARLRAELAARDPRTLTADELLALADCRCAAPMRAKFIDSLGEGRGVLPQVLVPAIRREIRGDETLNALMAVTGAFKSIAAWILGAVLDDQALADKIRSGVLDKIKRALGSTASLLDARPKLTFDLFMPENRGRAAASVSFTARDQAARAALVFAHPDLWGGASADAALLETSRVLSEWHYVVGERDNETEHVSGGLLLDHGATNSAALKGYEAGSSAMPGLFSGSYAVRFEKAEALELALNVQEHWTRAPGSTTLEEQAAVLDAAAIAFSRLKPTARSASGTLFAPVSGLFPGNAHALPLVFLAGFGASFEASFVDSERRLVFSATDRAQPASLSDLGRLLGALTRWYAELVQIAPEDVPEEAAGSLDGSAASLQRAMQLVTFVILRDHDLAAANVTEAARALSALTRAEAVGLKSDFLVEKIDALALDFVTNRLRPMLSAGVKGESALAAFASAHAAMHALYEVRGAAAPVWMEAAARALDEVLGD